MRRTFTLQPQLPELLHTVDLFGELQPWGAWGTLSLVHTEVLQAPKPQMRLNPQAWLRKGCPNTRWLSSSIFTIPSYACLFLLPVSDHSALPPPSASIQTHFFFTGKHHFCKPRHVPYVKFRKQVRRSLTLTGHLLSHWLNCWSFIKLWSWKYIPLCLLSLAAAIPIRAHGCSHGCKVYCMHKATDFAGAPVPVCSVLPISCALLLVEDHGSRTWTTVLKRYSSDLMIFIMSLERSSLWLSNLELPIALTVTARYRHLLHH